MLRGPAWRRDLSLGLPVVHCDVPEARLVDHGHGHLLRGNEEGCGVPAVVCRGRQRGTPLRMTEPANIYDRLAAQQQRTAQRVIVRVVMPLCAVVAAYWLVTDGPSRKPLTILCLVAIACTVLAVERWKRWRHDA